MGSVTANLPVLIVAVVLIASYLMPLFARYRRDWCAPTAAGALVAAFAGSAALAARAVTGEVVIVHLGGWSPPWGIEVAVDALTAFMLLVLTGVAMLILVYTISDIGHELAARAVGWYYTSFLLLVAAMLGMAMARDLFNLYVFIEVSSIGACALVASRDTEEATEAAFKYLMLAALGSGLVLFSIGLLYQVTGNLNFAFVAEELTLVYGRYPHVIWVAMCFMVVGFAVKAALFPLHVWLPDAHSFAPSPSSAVLSGLVIKIYAYAMLRLLYTVFGTQFLGADLAASLIRVTLLTLATLSIIGGSLFALVQVDVKRMLAYSSVAQIGYVFLGVGLATPSGLAAALIHVLNHALIKACLFLAAGAIIYRTGKRRTVDLAGMGRRMPVTMAAFTIGALAMIGLPLFNGFVSKWLLFVGGMQARQPVVAGVIILSALLNALYYLPIIWRAYFTPGPEQEESQVEVPLPMLIPIGVLALACILFGVWPAPALALVNQAVATLVPW
ncbi:MAG: monovalent cation/H+ antiporter subunit D family protein [bacterium]|nr:monovalent cation/H+ antiporter subunit D family protein [bacterium]